MKYKLFAVLLCFSALFSCVGTVCISAESNTYTVEQAQSVIDGIIAFRQDKANAASPQELIDGELTRTAGTGSEWYILGLSQIGEYDFSAYEASLLGYLEDNQIYSASSRQKYALCLSSIGSTDGYISKVMIDSIGEQGIMSWIYGLHLLNNGYANAEHSAQTVIEKLLSLQCDDGGWSLTGETGDVDVSAMALQALSVHYGSKDTVKAAADKALAFLSERQLQDGDYSSYGVANPESGAQVLVALSSLGIDPTKDARFIKNGKTVIDGILKYRLSDGSFCHSIGGGYNDNATVQAFYSMVAYIRMTSGKTPLYILDRSDPDGVKPPENDNINDVKDQEDPSSDEPVAQGERKISYKLWVSIAIAAAGGIVCLVLFIIKKRNLKNFIAVIAVTAIAIAAVCFTELRSADDYYNGEDKAKENVIGSVTLTIRCDTVADRSESYEYIPQNGIILDVTEFDIEDGDTVYGILTEAARKYGIRIENNGSADMAYIAGIGHLYEFDFGDLSGWVYRVNGKDPSVGCGEYKLSDGDAIEWHYTLSMGNDIK